MTTEVFSPAPLYTVAGTGPYAVPFPYSAKADLIVQVRSDLNGAPTTLAPSDWSISPIASQTSGNVSLGTSAATAHAGKTMLITRETVVEQGWVGGAPREKGLEFEKDRQARAIQDLQRELQRVPRQPVGASPLKPMFPSPQAGRAIVSRADGQGWENGPSASEIAYANAAGAVNQGFWIDSAQAFFSDDTYSYTSAPGKVVVSPGSVIQSRKERFSWQVVVVGSAGPDIVATFGSVLARVQVSERGRNIRAFGAKGDGASDDLEYINNAIDAAFAAGGGDVYVPAGTFIVTGNINIRDNVFLRGEGYVSHIRNIATFGFAKCTLVTGNVGDIPAGNGMFAEVEYPILAAAPGDFSVTPITPAHAANFAIGDIVGVASYERWTDPFPNDHEKLLNLNEVVAVSGGVITLRYPLKDVYSADLGNPTIRRVSGSFNGYAGAPMWMSKNCGATDLRITQSTGLTSGWYAIFACGVNQRFENIWMDNASTGIGSNALSHSIIRNIQVRFEAGLMDFADWQNDNLIENVKGSRFAANASLNRIGLAINNGSDILVRNVAAALRGWGRFSFAKVFRGTYERCTITGAGATEALLLGLGDECVAFDVSIIDPFQYGITLAGQRHRVHSCRIPKVGIGGYAVYALSAVDVCYVHDNEFGISGAETERDRFVQSLGIKPTVVVYNNRGFDAIRDGKTNWAGFAQTSETASYAVLFTLQSRELRDLRAAFA
jgi:hypothetical protein